MCNKLWLRMRYVPSETLPDFTGKKYVNESKK